TGSVAASGRSNDVEVLRPQQACNEAGSAGPNAGGHPAKASFGGDQLRTGDENRVISPLVVLEGVEQLLASHCFFNGIKWWPGTELNRRRQPFQGCALPPELPGHFSSQHLSAHRPAGQSGCAALTR